MAQKGILRGKILSIFTLLTMITKLTILTIHAFFNTNYIYKDRIAAYGQKLHTVVPGTVINK